MMGGRLWAFAGTLLPAACQTGASTLSAYRAGSTFGSRQADYDQCKIASWREIQQASATNVSGGYYDPGRVQCSTFYGTTTCQRIGGINIPARTSTSDENEGLRDRYIKRCMQSKGYMLLNLPVCPSQEERQRAMYQPQPTSPAEITCSAGVNMEG